MISTITVYTNMSSDNCEVYVYDAQSKCMISEVGVDMNAVNMNRGDPALHLQQARGHLNWRMGLPAL